MPDAYTEGSTDTMADTDAYVYPGATLADALTRAYRAEHDAYHNANSVDPACDYCNTAASPQIQHDHVQLRGADAPVRAAGAAAGAGRRAAERGSDAAMSEQKARGGER